MVKRAQGRGLGTRCRAAVLELAFQHLNAEAAKSWVLHDNYASIGVSTKLGYREIGEERIVENGRELIEVVYQLNATDWFDSPARQRYPSTIDGVDPLIELLSR